MSSNSSSRPLCLPPFSTRTLQHPSFLPLYLSADLELANALPKNQTVPAISHAEFFYTDPTRSCGGRIPNVVSDLRVSDCFRLNTPPPIMSTCIAPPIGPGPFGSALHAIRDLGSSTVKVNPLVSSGQLCQVVVQLTQEEDQAITNLLKLHHQEPPPRSQTVNASLKSPLSAQSPDLGSGALPSREGRCWSVKEIEAANTLTCFSMMEMDRSLEASTTPPPDPPSDQSQGGFAFAGGTENIHLPVCEKSCKLPSSQESTGYLAREQTLSDSERDAIQALQSLGTWQP